MQAAIGINLKGGRTKSVRRHVSPALKAKQHSAQDDSGGEMPCGNFYLPTTIYYA